MNSRNRIIAMFEGSDIDHLPNMAITMMFAADQVGAQYLDYAMQHQVLEQAQIATAERFGIDHVSVISDPAVEAADCGASVIYYPNQPPAIEESNALLLDKRKLIRLTAPTVESGKRMSNRVQGVAGLKQKVGSDKLIEGWVEGPCAEAADLRGINNLMLDCMDDTVFVTDLFSFVVGMEITFAQAQVEAGADIIGVGDAAASLVGPRIYSQLVWPYEKHLVEAIHQMGARVRLHICGNTRRILDGMGRLGCDIVDLDYLVPISEARTSMSSEQVLLGNIDPVSILRNSTPETVYHAIEECHRQAGKRYIVGAGCEVPRDTPAENLLALKMYAQTHLCPDLAVSRC